MTYEDRAEGYEAAAAAFLKRRFRESADAPMRLPAPTKVEHSLLELNALARARSFRHLLKKKSCQMRCLDQREDNESRKTD